MKIVHIENNKRVKKTKKELEKEKALYKGAMKNAMELVVSEYKFVPTDKPTYIVEMTMEELQLVSFYLELEKRKPIMNVKIDAKLTKEELL